MMLASRNCTYSVDLGLIEMLSAISKLDKQEVWSVLADKTQVCFDRLEKKPGQRESWTRVEFPNTAIRMKIRVNRVSRIYDVKTHNYVTLTNPQVKANITFEPNAVEKFTSRQVEEFLVEKVLLGIDD